MKIQIIFHQSPNLRHVLETCADAWRLAFRRAASGSQWGARETERSGAKNYQKWLWGGWRFGIACVVLMQMRSRDRTCPKYSWGLAASVLLQWQGAQWWVSLRAGTPTRFHGMNSGDLAHGVRRHTHEKKSSYQIPMEDRLCQIQWLCCAALASYRTRLGLLFKFQYTPPHTYMC
jgi:hypothetical protein